MAEAILLPVLKTRAPAKVNLTLHILGRREDGYHTLESLVAFAGVADFLSLTPGPDLTLSVDGPSAAQAGPVADNLVVKAVGKFLARRPGLKSGSFHLTKRLPAEAGIGGGSSDAASALRLLARLNGLSLTDPDILAAARETGADVPVCLDPRARVMSGTGAEVGPALPMRLFSVLANPRVAAPTPAVFRELGLNKGQMLVNQVLANAGWSMNPSEAAIGQLSRGRNDLEAPAIRVAPAIAEALSLVRANPECQLARMSGSGATVFGLYEDCHSAARAARAIKAQRPEWWVKPTILR